MARDCCRLWRLESSLLLAPLITSSVSGGISCEGEVWCGIVSARVGREEDLRCVEGDWKLVDEVGVKSGGVADLC